MNNPDQNQEKQQDLYIHESLLAKAAHAGVVKVFSQEDVRKQVEKVLNKEDNRLPKGLVSIKTKDKGKDILAFVLAQDKQE